MFCKFISGRGIQQVQKKRTIYPEWNTCFDAHLYDGRVINLVVMEKPNRFLAEITLSAKVLAEKCTDGNIATAWVRKKNPKPLTVFMALNSILLYK